MHSAPLQYSSMLITLMLTLLALGCDKATPATPVAPVVAPTTPTAEVTDPAASKAPEAPAEPVPTVVAEVKDHTTTATKKELNVGDWVIHHTLAEAWVEHAKTKQRQVLYSQERGLKDCKANMEKGEEGNADYQGSGALISVVGDVVSYYVSEYGDCGGAHPFAFTSFRTLDLKTLKNVPLNSLFDDAQINAALDADPFVKKVRAQEDADDCKMMVESPEPKSDGFAFHHIKDGKIAVRIGLSHSIGVCRGTFAQAGIYLTPTATLMEQLNAAKANGLLMDVLMPKLPE